MPGTECLALHQNHTSKKREQIVTWKEENGVQTESESVTRKALMDTTTMDIKEVVQVEQQSTSRTSVHKRKQKS
jgi:ethanolamine utilization protein EutP (predicted NTPase)